MAATNKKVLIDLKPLIADLELLAKYEDDYKQSTILGVIHTIRNRPIIEAAEVIHGRWIKFQFLGCEPTYECSVCGKLHDQDYNFCNNCGAKMDLEEK